MVLLGPIEVDTAGAHGLEGALHSERADIDVAEDDGDEEHGDQAMHDLCELHSQNVRDVEGKQQQVAGPRNGYAAANREPEDQLFSSIEATGLRVLGGDEAAALFEPDDVNLARYIVLDENRRDENQAGHEGEARKVVYVFKHFGQRAEGVVSDHRHQDELSERDIEARQAERDE